MSGEGVKIDTDFSLWREEDSLRRAFSTFLPRF